MTDAGKETASALLKLSQSGGMASHQREGICSEARKPPCAATRFRQYNAPRAGGFLGVTPMDAGVAQG